MASLRQKQLVQVIANRTRSGKALNMYQAMRETGYSEYYSRNPSQVTKTKSFSKAMEEVFSSESLTHSLLKLFNAHKVQKMKFDSQISQEELEQVCKETNSKLVSVIRKEDIAEVVLAVPDRKVILKTLDMIFRLMDLYNQQNQHYERELENLSEEELDEIITNHGK